MILLIVSSVCFLGRIVWLNVYLNRVWGWQGYYKTVVPWAMRTTADNHSSSQINLKQTLVLHTCIKKVFAFANALGATEHLRKSNTWVKLYVIYFVENTATVASHQSKHSLTTHPVEGQSQLKACSLTRCSHNSDKQIAIIHNIIYINNMHEKAEDILRTQFS